ncbi:hypothetical protein HHI36_010923 [Cryptolaemus montrouzieri]|uniref:Uncharacterized protein n=1 Tax=Cryptolaemus montrouzieri TaxID=559131 RepID=A0ABD2MKA4_9CUCU
MSTEIKKMKQGMSYSCKEKTIILNVFKYFKTQFPDKCVTDLVRRTAKATGCSEKSIFQFRKEEASAEGFKAPSKTKIRKNININSRDIKYDDSVRQAIRNIVYDLKFKNIIPSLNTILKNVHANGQLPHFSLMTLRRLLFDMGFSYEKVGNKSVLIEKPQEKQGLSKNKKLKNDTNSDTCSQLKNTNIQKTYDHISNPQNVMPTTNTKIITPVSNLPKPTPQHPLNHLNNNSNSHLNHIGQTLEYQTHPHSSLLSMQGTSQNHNYTVMGPPMHSQPPIPHNMPLMLNHRRPLPTHSSHIVPSSYDMNLRREDFVVGV